MQIKIVITFYLCIGIIIPGICVGRVILFMITCNKGAWEAKGQYAFSMGKSSRADMDG